MWLEQRRRQRGREGRRSGGDRVGHAGSDGPWGELWTFIYLYQTLPRVMGSRTKVWTRGRYGRSGDVRTGLGEMVVFA